MTILCLEGPSYGGKTTAIGHLREIPELAGKAVFFDCYVRHLHGTRAIPAARTGSAAEQLAAFETFMSAEADRVAQAAAHPDPLVILDRSVDTLLAHAYGIDQLYGFGVYAPVRRRLEELPHLRPDHTVYLDVPAPTLRRRRAAADHPAEAAYFLHDTAFLTHARAYFVETPHPPIARRITVLPADRPADIVAKSVQALAEATGR